MTYHFSWTEIYDPFLPSQPSPVAFLFLLLLVTLQFLLLTSKQPLLLRNGFYFCLAGLFWDIEESSTCQLLAQLFYWQDSKPSHLASTCPLCSFLPPQDPAKDRQGPPHSGEIHRSCRASCCDKNHGKPPHPLPLHHTHMYTSYFLFDILTTITVCCQWQDVDLLYTKPATGDIKQKGSVNQYAFISFLSKVSRSSEDQINNE